MAKQSKSSSAGITGYEALIPNGGEMGKRIRGFDWRWTSLGTIEHWPQSLLTAVNILLQSPVPIVMLWNEDGYMIYNDAYSLFAGARHPQLLGSKVVEGWPEVAEFNQNVMDQGLQGKTLSYKDQQLTLFRNNVAEEVWMNLSYSPVFDESGKPAGVWSIVVETSERVQAEQRQHRAETALKAERERLYSLFMQAPALIAVLRGPEHIFEMANSVYIATVAPGREILGKTVLEAIPELAGQGIKEVLDQVLQTGEPYVGEMAVKLDKLRSGNLEEAYFNLIYQPINDAPDGKPTGILVHAVDVSDQVLSRRRAEQLSAQLEAVFDSLPDGLYIAENDTITRINQRGAEVLGFESPDKVPRTITELYQQLSIRNIQDGKTVNAEDSTIGNALRGISTQHHAVRVHNPLTGSEQILRTAGAPIRNQQGEIIGAVAINNDLTEQYKLQEKVQKEVIRSKLLSQKTKLLKQQNDELTKLNATKDEFIALTSHQLRTPATGVKQYIAMLMQGYAGPVTAEQDQFLERAYESNERQLHIIEDILRVARVDMGQIKIRKTLHDMCQLVQSIIDEQADRFNEHRQTLITNFPNEPLYANIDNAQLRMAIGNILDNAVKYTADNKQITVNLQKIGSKKLQLEVVDEGVGIAPEDINRLFQKFSRIPNPRSIAVGGTGLGLYWSKSIVELHGGTITVSSSKGKGTRFTITLPVNNK